MIRSALNGIDSYTINREAKPVRMFNPIYVRQPRELIQLDLIDIQNMKQWNDETGYLMCVIDSLTRFLWVMPMKTKRQHECVKTYRDIVGEMGIPKRILCDRGKEWTSGLFKHQLREHGTVQTLANGISGKAPTVERVQRTLQSLMYKYMEERQTRRYIDVLPQLVSSYNNREHRMIGMTPTEAEDATNYERLLAKVEKNYARSGSQGKRQRRAAAHFGIGDTVRILLERGKFARGYEEIFSRESFRIVHINTNLPVPMFSLSELDTNAPIDGTFYARELQHAPGNIFKVSEVLRREVRNGKRMAFVSWLGYGSEHNSWIDEDADVNRIYDGDDNE